MREKSRRKWQLWVAIVTALALVVGGVGAYLHFTSDSPPAIEASDPWSYQIDAAGSTEKTPEGVRIIVPPDAVDGEATLTATPVESVAADQHAPFDGVRSGAVKFDISLTQNGVEIQPAQPLTIEFPLEGDFLPESVDPTTTTALLYTEMAPNQHLLMPSDKKDGNLSSKLFHLSPKIISFVDPDKFYESFGIANGEIAHPEDCLSETDEVEFGPASEGWSNDDDGSPINACLQVDGDTVSVGIANHVNYIFSVASTLDGEQIATSFGDVEENLVELFAGTIFPDEDIDAFLGQDGLMNVTIPTSELPATIQLRANPNTFLAGIGWFAFKFSIGIATGKTGSDLVEVAEALLNVGDVTSCLQTAFETASGEEDFGFLDAVDFVSSKCMEAILDAIGYQPNLWDLFGRWFNVIAEGISGGLRTVARAFEGIRMQIAGDVMVEVVRSAPECPTDEEVEQIVRNDNPYYRDLSQVDAEIVVCEEGWANASIVTSQISDGIEWENQIGFNLLLRYKDSEWGAVFGGQDMDAREFEVDGVLLCEQVPPSIKDTIWC